MRQYSPRQSLLSGSLPSQPYSYSNSYFGILKNSSSGKVLVLILVCLGWVVLYQNALKKIQNQDESLSIMDVDIQQQQQQQEEEKGEFTMLNEGIHFMDKVSPNLKNNHVNNNNKELGSSIISKMSEVGNVRKSHLNPLEQAIGFSESYPTYELDGAGTDNAAKEEAEVIANETEELEKVIEAEEEQEEVEMNLKSEIEAAEETKQQTTTESDSTSLNVDHPLIIDQDAYDKAPRVKVPKAKFMKQGLWWSLKAYEKYYAVHETKWHVPRINPKVNLTFETFHHKFRRHGLPVIINFESLRHLGFKTKTWTFEDLEKLFPYNEADAKKALLEYKANGIRKDDEEIDLGPAIHSIMSDERLAKMGSLRNYPRNLKVTRAAIEKLGVEYPPLLPTPPIGSSVSSQWQLPTIWMGTSTSDTRFHHDCCDNFVMMLTGTKRFTLAPPTDWRVLSPVCVGSNKSLCWAKVPHPNSKDLTPKSAEIMSKVHKIIVDIAPGEILYMPAGWFHHVQNLGPTIMVNTWTRGREQIGLLKALKDAAATVA